MTPLEILQGARELLTPPGNWTTGYFAKDVDGDDVDYEDSSAVCWCAMGATGKAAASVEESVGADRLLKKTLGIDSIAEWNDDPQRTHAEVLAGFDAAIELAKAEAQETV